MPKRDIYHFEIRTALEKDGWTITSYAIDSQKSNLIGK